MQQTLEPLDLGGIDEQNKFGLVLSFDIEMDPKFRKKILGLSRWQKFLHNLLGLSAQKKDTSLKKDARWSSEQKCFWPETYYFTQGIF
jgi:hypothetical protein